MNSENSPTPESDNTNLEPIEVSEDRTDELVTEVTSDSKSDLDVDMWEDDDTLAAFEPSSTISSEESNWTAPAEEPELAELESISTSEEIPLDSEDPIEADTPSPKPASEPELFVDRWLDETENSSSTSELAQTEVASEVEQLQQQKDDLHQEIETLKAQKEQMLLQQARDVQENMGRMVEEGTKELKERKMALQVEIEKLERRKERIDREMRSNFAGSSQELAVRVQGFKDYLVGSLQDLAAAAEKLELARAEAPARTRERVRGERREPRREGETRTRRRSERGRERSLSQAPEARFTEPTFADQNRRIRQLIDKYRNSPDYYGSPWQLRRTFEVAQAKKVQEWFFVQGGRGAVDSMGSRLQNILIASAAISILHSLYGDRCRVLVLTDTPENLGEWRRGLQDCLGISRNNFGTNRGVVLFDSPDILVQRAERLLADKLLPIIIIDETEELLNLAILKFPLWLAFASTNRSASSSYLY